MQSLRKKQKDRCGPERLGAENPCWSDGVMAAMRNSGTELLRNARDKGGSFVDKDTQSALWGAWV